MLPKQVSSRVLGSVLICKRLPRDDKTNSENQCHAAQCIVIPPFGRAACGNNERRDEVPALRGDEQSEQNPEAAPFPFLQRTPGKGDNGDIQTDDPKPGQEEVELGMRRPGRIADVTGQSVQVTQDLYNRGQGNKTGGVLEVQGRNISRKVGFMNMWSGSTCS
jgi:hypothetical protein